MAMKRCYLLKQIAFLTGITKLASSLTRVRPLLDTQCALVSEMSSINLPITSILSSAINFHLSRSKKDLSIVWTLSNS